MKIKSYHYQYMKDAIAGLEPDTVAYLKQRVAEDSRVKDAAKRLRWDLLCASEADSRWICDNLYYYADDTHIDTALRKIMRELDIEGSN